MILVFPTERMRWGEKLGAGSQFNYQVRERCYDITGVKGRNLWENTASVEAKGLLCGPMDPINRKRTDLC